MAPFVAFHNSCATASGSIFALVPPAPLIAGRMIFAVVDGAERHGEFVAHFERKPSRLRVANMMGMGRGAAADDAWLLGDKAKVLF